MLVCPLLPSAFHAACIHWNLLLLQLRWEIICQEAKLGKGINVFFSARVGAPKQYSEDPSSSLMILDQTDLGFNGSLGI